MSHAKKSARHVAAALALTVLAPACVRRGDGGNGETTTPPSSESAAALAGEACVQDLTSKLDELTPKLNPPSEPPAKKSLRVSQAQLIAVPFSPGIGLPLLTFQAAPDVHYVEYRICSASGCQNEDWLPLRSQLFLQPERERAGQRISLELRAVWEGVSAKGEALLRRGDVYESQHSWPSDLAKPHKNRAELDQLHSLRMELELRAGSIWQASCKLTAALSEGGSLHRPNHVREQLLMRRDAKQQCEALSPALAMVLAHNGTEVFSTQANGEQARSRLGQEENMESSIPGSCSAFTSTPSASLSDDFLSREADVALIASGILGIFLATHYGSAGPAMLPRLAGSIAGSFGGSILGSGIAESLGADGLGRWISSMVGSFIGSYLLGEYADRYGDTLHNWQYRQHAKSLAAKGKINKGFWTDKKIKEFDFAGGKELVDQAEISEIKTSVDASNLKKSRAMIAVASIALIVGAIDLSVDIYSGAKLSEDPELLAMREERQKTDDILRRMTQIQNVLQDQL